MDICLTHYCNMKCAFCPHAIHEQRDFQNINLDPDVVKKQIKNSDQCNIIGDGEVLLLPNFLDYIPDPVSSNCALFFSTSGVALDEKIAIELVRRQVTSINFSIDAGDEQTYNKMRGPYWNELWNNIEKLIEIKKDNYKPIIKTNMIICNSNIHTLPNLVKKLIDLKNIECLLIYKPHKKAEQSQWCDGSGKFLIDNELTINQDNEYKYISQAIDVARQNNFNLIARDRFLNYNYQHQQM